MNLDGEYPCISVRRVAVRHPQVKGKYSDIAPPMQDEATDKLGGNIYGQKPKEDAPVPDVDMEDYELPF